MNIITKFARWAKCLATGWVQKKVVPAPLPFPRVGIVIGDLPNAVYIPVMPLNYEKLVEYKERRMDGKKPNGEYYFFEEVANILGITLQEAIDIGWTVRTEFNNTQRLKGLI